MKRIPLDPGLSAILAGVATATAGFVAMLGQMQASTFISLVASASAIVGLMQSHPRYGLELHKVLASLGFVAAIVQPLAGGPAAIASGALLSAAAIAGLVSAKRVQGVELAALALAMALASAAAIYLIGVPEYAIFRDVRLVGGISMAIAGLPLRETINSRGSNENPRQ